MTYLVDRKVCVNEGDNLQLVEGLCHQMSVNHRQVVTRQVKALQEAVIKSQCVQNPRDLSSCNTSICLCVNFRPFLAKWWDLLDLSQVKKTFGSGLYAPWRGPYCYGLIFFCKVSFEKHPSVDISAWRACVVFQ